ncbi:LysM peptidoglycan-binding domain-containing protein [Aquibium sp. A9E412]|uniref:LysM peptidoglycan-binding domain-containing protein n=1 Tax=Aquibium sp. A9E412 TaxID=2976767 RepID=UPI0025B27790|nr:LysM peptidoglycan-binding domain-containing protein [Aquibium sp. A9E412]MDN2567174.1 LysM peptidoglycan-binding domain-containing protein [Aquibium sp. A9E412]
MGATPVRAALFLLGALIAAGATAYFAGALDPYLGRDAPVVAALPEGDAQAGRDDAAAPQPATPITGADAPQDAGAEAPEAGPDGAGETPAATEVVVPAFDLVRVEPDGSIVIAGRAAPGASVEVVTGSRTIGTAEAGPSGDFAVVLDEPLGPGDYEIVLRATSPDAVVATSIETAIVSVPDSETGQVLALVEKPGEPSRFITVPEAAPASEPGGDGVPAGTAETAETAETAAPEPAGDAAVPGGASEDRVAAAETDTDAETEAAADVDADADAGQGAEAGAPADVAVVAPPAPDGASEIAGTAPGGLAAADAGEATGEAVTQDATPDVTATQDETATPDAAPDGATVDPAVTADADPAAPDAGPAAPEPAAEEERETAADAPAGEAAPAPDVTVAAEDATPPAPRDDGPARDAQADAADAAAPAGPPATTTDDTRRATAPDASAVDDQARSEPDAPTPDDATGGERMAALAPDSAAAPDEPAPQPDAPAPGRQPSVFVQAVEIDGREIFVAGVADPGRRVRVYANEILLGDAIASPGGQFLVEAVRDLPVGDYIVRADMLADNGADVIARAAVPFEREPGETIAAVAPDAMAALDDTPPAELAAPEAAPSEAAGEAGAPAAGDTAAAGAEDAAAEEGATGEPAARDAAPAPAGAVEADAAPAGERPAADAAGPAEDDAAAAAAPADGAAPGGPTLTPPQSETGDAGSETAAAPQPAAPGSADAGGETAMAGTAGGRDEPTAAADEANAAPTDAAPAAADGPAEPRDAPDATTAGGAQQAASPAAAPDAGDVPEVAGPQTDRRAADAAAGSVPDTDDAADAAGSLPGTDDAAADAAPDSAAEKAERLAAAGGAASGSAGAGEAGVVTAPKLQAVDSAVIIRRGDTLWRISRRVYGRGIRYSTIYLANQDQIRDPDRIWPGQVFTVPGSTEEGEKADMSRIGDQAITVPR